MKKYSNILTPDPDFILAHTKHLWEEMRGQSIFITGATGFWGSWLLESFAWINDKLNLNASLTALSRNPQSFAQKAPHLYHHPAIKFCAGDVRNFVFPHEKFAYIIHAATDVSNKTPLETTLDTIVRGTEHTLQFALTCGAKKILLASSGAVYGKTPPNLTPMPEDYVGSIELTAPHAIYGLAKRVMENMGREYMETYGLAIKIARGFAMLGPYMPLEHFAVGNFLLNGLRGEPIKVQSDGAAYRSYIYAAEHIVWLWHILLQGKAGHAYNVGSEEAVSVRDLANLVAEHFHPKPKVIIEQTPKPQHIPEYYVPATKKAQKELNLSLQLNLFESIQRTKRWCLENE